MYIQKYIQIDMYTYIYIMISYIYIYTDDTDTDIHKHIDIDINIELCTFRVCLPGNIKPTQLHVAHVSESHVSSICSYGQVRKEWFGFGFPMQTAPSCGKIMQYLRDYQDRVPKV